MPAIEPYWMPWKGMEGYLFSIRIEKRSGFLDVSDSSETMLPFYSFVYLSEGEVLLEIQGQPYLCQARHALMIPQNIPFKVLYFKGSHSIEGGFSIKVVKDVSHPCLQTPQPVLQHFDEEEAAFVESLLRLLKKASDKNDIALVSSTFDLFLCLLHPKDGLPGHPVVNRFLEMVFSRTGKPRKVSDYASDLCITPNYLNRLVRSHTLHSAMEWIEISRLNLAKSLLKQGKMSVQEVASAVGIDDQSYFTRFFKKYEGCTPTRFRELAVKTQGRKE